MDSHANKFISFIFNLMRSYNFNFFKKCIENSDHLFNKIESLITYFMLFKFK